jgi:hypothetical protein
MRATKDHIDDVYNRLTSIEVDQCILEHKTACDLKKATQRIEVLEDKRATRDHKNSFHEHLTLAGLGLLASKRRLVGNLDIS